MEVAGAEKGIVYQIIKSEDDDYLKNREPGIERTLCCAGNEPFLT